MDGRYRDYMLSDITKWNDGMLMKEKGYSGISAMLVTQ